MIADPRVVRLLTLAEVRDDDSDDRRMSVSARHEAVLADGRHVLLLDDRGWSASIGGAGGSRREELTDIWATSSVEDVERTARVVVGPDEPFGERSQADMEADHRGPPGRCPPPARCRRRCPGARAAAARCRAGSAAARAPGR